MAVGSQTSFGLVENLPALQVVVPLLAAVLSAFMRNGPRAWLFTTVVVWCLPVIAIALLLQVLETGTISYAMGGWKPPIGIEYVVDVFSAFALVVVTMVSAIIMPFARRSIAREIDGDKQAWFYTMFLVCLTGLLGIIITGDAFNAFVFLEISSLSTYVMIAMGRDRRALLAAYQYLIMGTIGATFYVIGVGILYSVTGTLNMADLADRISNMGGTPPILAALAFITAGIGLKLALFPMHNWLPGAYAHAPSFASAFLAATATKVAIYLLMRFYFSVFGLGTASAASKSLGLPDIPPVLLLLFILSIAAMFGASIVAIFQRNAKKLLAYSSIGQIGYITLGISLNNVSGLTGATVHIFNHALMKGALFLALGAVVYRLASCRLEQMNGIGRKMPITMACFVIAGLAIIGVPGTVGFISKWYLSIGALERGLWWLVVLIMLSSLLAVVYIGRVVEVAYFREPSEAVSQVSDPPLMILVPVIVLTATTIYFGFDTSISADIADKAAKLLMGGRQ